MVTGWSYSLGGDKTESKGGSDLWALKLNSTNGQLVWQKTFGGSGSDLGISAEETADGGYIFGSYAASSDGDLSNNFGGFDLWV